MDAVIITSAWFICGMIATYLLMALDRREGIQTPLFAIWLSLLGPFALLSAVWEVVLAVSRG